MDIYDQLKRDEGNKKFPYTDTVGKITIGVGFNLTDVGLSPDEIAYILNARVNKLDAALQVFPWYTELDSVRQGALLNMAYNMGLSGLLHFPSMLHCLSIKDWAGAQREALASTWAEQVGPRAVRLGQQLLTGEWQ